MKVKFFGESLAGEGMLDSPAVRLHGEAGADVLVGRNREPARLRRLRRERGRHGRRGRDFPAASEVDDRLAQDFGSRRSVQKRLIGACAEKFLEHGGHGVLDRNERVATGLGDRLPGSFLEGFRLFARGGDGRSGFFLRVLDNAGGFGLGLRYYGLGFGAGFLNPVAIYLFKQTLQIF